MIHGCMNKLSNAGRRSEERKEPDAGSVWGEGEKGKEGAGEQDEKVRREGVAMLA